MADGEPDAFTGRGSGFEGEVVRENEVGEEADQVARREGYGGVHHLIQQQVNAIMNAGGSASDEAEPDEFFLLG